MAQPGIEELPNGATRVVLVMDRRDQQSLLEALANVSRHVRLPPAGHDDVNYAGRAVGEICRQWVANRKRR